MLNARAHFEMVKFAQQIKDYSPVTRAKKRRGDWECPADAAAFPFDVYSGGQRQILRLI